MKAPTLLRRSALAILIAAGSVGLLAPVTANAAAPMVKTSAPGYYRMMLGDFEVTALSDGTVSLPVDKILTNTTPAKVDQALGKYYLKSPVETSVNGYLINTGDKLILVDTGAAGLFGPTLGRLAANLKAAGYTPEQVDEVYITHMHGDHVGGLMTGDQRSFPNAIVRADQHDADYWLSQENLDKAPADNKQAAIARKKAYADAAKNGYLVASAHLSFPGIGHIRSEGKGYAWVPVNYTPVR